MKLIVDSGVAVKWFIPEVLSTEAKAWRDATTDLHTLAFFFDLEIASVLWKKIGRSAKPMPTRYSRNFRFFLSPATTTPPS
jgi:predicted nucleic acid-binding protein